MERVDAKVLAKHWRWEKDKDGLAWLTFDKQGESANTFSKDALHELASSPSTRRLLFDAADTRLRKLRPEALAARLRSALTPLL